MKITITGKSKEIAELAMELQARQKSSKKVKNSKLIRKQLKRLSEASKQNLKYSSRDDMENLSELTRAMTDLLSLQSRS